MSATPEAIRGSALVAGRRRADPRVPLEDPTVPPVRAAGIELHGELAGSGHRQPPALVRRADGQTVQLTPLLYNLLAEIDGIRGHAELADALAERVGRHVTADDVRFLTEQRLRPLGLLRHPDGTEPTGAKANPLLGLRLRCVVSDPHTTRRLTAPLAPLFRPPVVAGFVLAFLATTLWMAFDKGLASATHQALYEPELLLVVLALTLASAGFHELGHAAACRYGGARAGGMGIGLYLLWPAFYTDVTDSYRLDRRGRLRVDLGGLYFNAIYGVGIAALWAVVRWDALLLVIAAQLIQMVRQLLPVVRFDGYHILADLVGVPDLFAHIKPTLRGMLPGRRRRGDFALRPWARTVVTLWVLLVVPLLATMLVLLVLALPRLVATAWDSLGQHAGELAAAWSDADAAAVALGLVSVLTLCLPVLGMTYLLVMVARRTVRWAWRTTDGRRPQRVLAVAAGAAIVAAVAWAWWPDGQYRPIGPDERWNLVDLPRFTQDAIGAPGGLTRPDRKPVRVSAVPVAWTPRRASLEASPFVARLASSAPAVTPPLGGTGPPSHDVPTPTAPGIGDPPIGPPALPDEPPSPRETPEVALPAPSEPAPSELPPPTPQPPPPLPPAPPSPAVAEPPPPAPTATEATASPPATPAPPPPPPPPPPPSGTATPAPPPPAAWPFPFAPPPAADAGDNLALAVVTRNDDQTFKVGVDLATVSDGNRVRNRNEAHAYASCRGCRATAISFQVVLVLGRSEVVTPVNAAVAANYQCERCTTRALAVQLVTAPTQPPSAGAMQEIRGVLAQLRTRSWTFTQLPTPQVYEALLAARSAVLTILERDSDTMRTQTRADATQPGVVQGDPDEAAPPVSEPAPEPDTAEPASPPEPGTTSATTTTEQAPTVTEGDGAVQTQP